MEKGIGLRKEPFLGLNERNLPYLRQQKLWAFFKPRAEKLDEPKKKRKKKIPNVEEKDRVSTVGRK